MRNVLCNTVSKIQFHFECDPMTKNNYNRIAYGGTACVRQATAESTIITPRNRP